ncbi:uncharacterized protein TNCV_2098491 [Trichonephila clavipes]|nr:uncharacterized protein TNCV_2098491 [Trichonephila clavipes]
MVLTFLGSIVSLKQLAAKGKVRNDRGCNCFCLSLSSTTFLNKEESEPNNFIWQQDGIPPHWHLSVCDWLNITVPNQLIGRKEPPDVACITWPTCSPDLKPCDFYMWKLIIIVRSSACS